MMEKVFLYLHVVFGYLFLFSLALAFFSRKKSPIHKYAGIAFCGLIGISIPAAIFLVICNGDIFLIPICVQTLLFSVLGVCIALNITIPETSLKLFKRITYINFIVFFCISFIILCIAGVFDVAITQATFFLFTTYLVRGKNVELLTLQRYHSVIMIQLTIGVLTAFLLSTIKPHVFFVNPPVIVVLNLIANYFAIRHFKRITSLSGVKI